jgi:hypothetical protein
LANHLNISKVTVGKYLNLGLVYINKNIVLRQYQIRNLVLFKESELVSGFFTEHSAAIFVFFFLAEYASIVLICILMSLLFLGGYLYPFSFLISSFNFPILEGALYGVTLGIKTCVLVFMFI